MNIAEHRTGNVYKLYAIVSDAALQEVVRRLARTIQAPSPYRALPALTPAQQPRRFQDTGG